MRTMIATALSTSLAASIAVYALQAPKIEEYSNNSYDVVCQRNVCDVFFSSTIEEQSNYRHLVKLIETADDGDTINLHLAGNGGSTDTVLYIHNAVRFSKATVNTVVEGPVYSAHAYLAMIGKNITIGRNVFFMFHSAAIQINTKDGMKNITLDEFCQLLKEKTDRGRSVFDKCMTQNKFYLKALDNYFEDYINQYLTEDEVRQVKDGYDVFIDSETMLERLKKK